MDFRLVDKTQVNPALLRFAAYCEEMAGGDGMPPRHGFRIGDLHWLFGYLVVADILEGGRDYRYTHSGDFWKTTLNYDLTGCRLSELEAIGRLPNFRSHYDQVVATRSPRYRTARMTWPDGHIVRYERLVVPFADDTGEPTMLGIAAQCDKSFAELMEYKAIGEPKLELELSSKSLAA